MLDPNRLEDALSTFDDDDALFKFMAGHAARTFREMFADAPRRVRLARDRVAAVIENAWSMEHGREALERAEKQIEGLATALRDAQLKLHHDVCGGFACCDECVAALALATGGGK